MHQSRGRIAGVFTVILFVACTAAAQTINIWPGMDKKGTSSDHWIDAFYFWLEAQGLTKPAVK